MKEPNTIHYAILSRISEHTLSHASTCAEEGLQVCLFSATILPIVDQTAKSIMINPLNISIGARNAATDTIDQKLVYVGNEEGKLLELRRMIKMGEIKPPTIIFVQSKERADELFHELIYDDINVEVIHAERTQAQV